MNHASIYILEQHETTKQIRKIERVHMTLILNCKNMLIWTLYGRIFDQTLQRATWFSIVSYLLNVLSLQAFGLNLQIFNLIFFNITIDGPYMQFPTKWLFDTSQKINKETWIELTLHNNWFLFNLNDTTKIGTISKFIVVIIVFDIDKF